MARELLHVSAIIDASILHKLLILFKNKCVGTPDIRAVEHGGETGGRLRSMPSGREFVLAYMAQHKSFNVKDMKAAGEAIGIKPATSYQALKMLVDRKAISKTAKGVYRAGNVKALKQAAAIKQGVANGSAVAS